MGRRHLTYAKLLRAALVGTLMLAAIDIVAADPFEKGYQTYRGDYVDWFDQRVPQNDADEFKSALKAAEQGHSNAQFLVGELYSAGQGTPQDETEATKWYRKAAEQGHRQTQRYLERQLQSGVFNETPSFARRRSHVVARYFGSSVMACIPSSTASTRAGPSISPNASGPFG